MYYYTVPTRYGYATKASNAVFTHLVVRLHEGQATASFHTSKESAMEVPGAMQIEEIDPAWGTTPHRDNFLEIQAVESLVPEG